ncbi:unnamed protein product [Adineta ricciae]|uniref:Uncharacterized protein n=1 Tax=Adineta ricciae TaxID=249248 RepID=A0A815DFW0_ADIRI|nr:unnamed protein product [Adineta ricciae]CAF1457704.1 unnamed protein product [Adineta ricciae]
MFTSINCTVFDIPLTWDRHRFEASRNKCRQARKLIDASVNAQFNKQLRDVFYGKLDIENNILESQQRLANQEKKVRALDNLTEVAAQSLTDYFDKRMETVRAAIQEHCNAIQEILREENDHWQEIHSAIDQNLITLDDIHPPKNTDQETPLANIHTIDEVDEEEHTSKLLNDKTVTPLLTEMIRKSRLLSNRSSIRRSNLLPSTENLIQSKEERFSVMPPLNSARRTLPVVDTTFVVKLEDSKSTESNQSHQVEMEQPEPLPVTTIIPIESVAMTTVTPIESISTAEVEASPSYSQPKPPARLYFSPTLLLDDGDSEPVQPVLSTIDQNQSINIKPKIATRRFGQTFLLDNVKTEEIDKSQDTENIRPNISDEIPFLIHSDPTLLPEKQTLNESDHPQLEIADIQKSIIYTKRRTHAVAEPKANPEPVHMTRRTARKPKPAMEIEPIKRPARKRKQSVVDLDDGNTNIVALPKKKANRATTKSTTRKPRAKKEKEIPIREPSPLPIIDRSKHYSTRFSTRSHRLNNQTLSTIATLSEDENQSKSKRSRTKSTKLDAEPVVKKPRAKKAKDETKTRAKSMITTRNRKK